MAASRSAARSPSARALGISRRSLIYKLQHFRDLGHQVEPNK
jgi:biotin operon repressor